MIIKKDNKEAIAEWEKTNKVKVVKAAKKPYETWMYVSQGMSGFMKIGKHVPKVTAPKSKKKRRNKKDKKPRVKAMTPQEWKRIRQMSKELEFTV